ncbi:putative amidoligase [Pseudomonas phage BroderSalsa]|nr:putative amidoligase [Pseudomonas phage BroderSalsa]
MPLIAEHLGLGKGWVANYESHEELPGIAAFGLEVELENIEGGRWPIIEGWEKKDDGSLRDGKEYIFDGPQSGASAVASVEAMAEALEGKVDPTFRCSTHCHMDVRDLTWDQYIKVVCTYMVFEDVFFDHCQPYRRQSNFCIPFQKNDWLSQRFGRQVIGAPSDVHRFHHLNGWPKYSGLNLQVTTNFGSIEFRGSHAMVSRGDLLGLMQRMLSIKAYVINTSKPDESVEAYLLRLMEEDLRAVFVFGIADDYQENPGAREQGLASAFHAVMSSLQAQQEGADFGGIFGRQAVDPNTQLIRDTLRAIIGRRLAWNAAVLLGLNIQVPRERPTIGTSIGMLGTINRLNGVNVTLSDIIAGTEVRDLRFLRTNWEEAKRLYGFDEQLTIHHIV